jgi:hypothetical protein
MDIAKLFTSSSEVKMKLKRSEIGKDWMVQKGSTILYVGPKDKCRSYMQHH